MPYKTDEEQGAMKLAEIIEDAVNDPEKAAERIEKKAKTTGVLKTIFDFIRDYKSKDPAQPNEEWLEQQFAKPEYAGAWGNKDPEKERKAAAVGMVQGVEDYENAKKSLRTHIELGGTRESWLAEQIEIGAANNDKAPEEYAKEVSDGLNEAMEENAEFLLVDTDGTKEVR